MILTTRDDGRQDRTPQYCSLTSYDCLVLLIFPLSKTEIPFPSKTWETPVR